MERILSITRALSDPNRLRAFMALKRRSLCVCQIGALLDLAPSTVSKHLSVLKAAGLLETEKKGKWVFYRRPADSVPKELAEAISWVDRHLSGDPRIKLDRKRLREMANVSLKEVCRIYLKRVA